MFSMCLCMCGKVGRPTMMSVLIFFLEDVAIAFVVEDLAINF